MRLQLPAMSLPLLVALVGCAPDSTEPTAVDVEVSAGVVAADGEGLFLYPCFQGAPGAVANKQLWVGVPPAAHRRAARGLVNLEYVAPNSATDPAGAAVHCTVPDRPDAIAAARAQLALPLSPMTNDGVTTTSTTVRGEDPPEEEEEDPAPSDPPTEDGSGGSAPGEGPDWDPYFSHEEGQVRQACDSGSGKAYDGEWYTCDPYRDQQRDSQVESIIRGNDDVHPYCGVIADDWSARHSEGQVGWLETIPISGAGIELGHYHDEGSVEPVGHIHIFAGNEEHERTITGWVRSAVHETLHALGFRHGEVVTGGQTFEGLNSMCSAVEDRG